MSSPSESLYMFAIVDQGNEESRSSRFVFAQFNGNETAINLFHHIWSNNHTVIEPSSWMEEQSFRGFGKGGGSVVLPASIDLKNLLTETQVRVITQAFKHGPVHHDGQPVYRFSILKGKFTLNHDVLHDHIHGRDDLSYDWDSYDSLCGLWDYIIRND